MFFYSVILFLKTLPKHLRAIYRTILKSLLSVFLKVTSFVNNFLCNTFFKMDLRISLKRKKLNLGSNKKMFS